MTVFDKRKIPLGTAACTALALLLGISCAGPSTSSNAPPAQSVQTAEPSPLEVARLMGELADSSNKVGWSIAAENQPLALFYLDKIDQVMVELSRVDRWEGIPVGSMALATMSGSLRALRSGVESGDWAAGAETYRAMTLSCNSCHSATAREYVVVTPVTGNPPPGQSFTVP